jgi:hypothetical protein
MVYFSKKNALLLPLIFLPLAAILQLQFGAMLGVVVPYKDDVTGILLTLLHESNQNTTKHASKSEPKVTIVVQIVGELGNHLCRIAFGRSIQLLLRDEYGIQNSKLVMRNEGSDKNNKPAPPATKTLQRCFPWTRSFYFGQGNTPEYNHILRHPDDNQKSNRVFLHLKQKGLDSTDPFTVRAAIDGAMMTMKNMSLSSTSSWLVAPPSLMVYADAFVSPPGHFFLNRYYKEFRNNTFQLSEECCPKGDNVAIPDPDESVFVSKEQIVSSHNMSVDDLFAFCAPSYTLRLIFLPQYYCRNVPLFLIAFAQLCTRSKGRSQVKGPVTRSKSPNIGNQVICPFKGG